MAKELADMKATARKSKYERQTGRQIDYAILYVKSCATRIRKLGDPHLS